MKTIFMPSSYVLCFSSASVRGYRVTRGVVWGRARAAEDSLGCVCRLALEELAEVVDVELKRASVEAAVEIYVAPRAAFGRERQAQSPEAARRVNLRRGNVAALPRPAHRIVVCFDFDRLDFAQLDFEQPRAVIFSRERVNEDGITSHVAGDGVPQPPAAAVATDE